jgi:hypothetical protein
MDTIFCFGDGYATGHIWPEWPQILQALLPNHSVITTAGIGAGDEFLVSGFVDLIPKINGQKIVFQWPYVKRFDKLIEDHSWQHIIDSDPVYHFNINCDVKNRSWWLSSASKVNDVVQYHAHYVQQNQQQRRREMYQELVSQTSANQNCHIVHTATNDQERFSHNERFKLIRQNEVQPSPAVHFYWLTEQIIPQLNVLVDCKLQSKMESLILQTTWTAYDPDRQEIWTNIVEQLKD